MRKAERLVKNLLERRGFDVVKSAPAEGLPTFKCMNFKSGERFYVEVKSTDQRFSLEQIKKFKEIMNSGQKILIATVGERKVEISQLKADFSREKKETFNLGDETTKKFPQTCQICGYKWEARIPHPKQCPRCKRYDYARVKLPVTKILFFLCVT